MPRKKRALVPGGVYHVYARGNRRVRLFFDDDDRRKYLGIWGSVVEEFRWHQLAFCLMDNHVHHLLETPEPDLNEGIQLAHSAYARYFNDRHGYVGHLFGGPYGASLATSDGAVMYFAAYVLLNPVRAGMCALPDEYPWSSVGGGPLPRWLDRKRLVEYFGSQQRLEQILEAIRIMGAAGFEPATSRV